MTLDSLVCKAFKPGNAVIHAECGDVHEFVHRDTIMKVTNKMQLYRLIYFPLSALHVSDDVFAHHQEHLNVFTVSGSIHAGCCRLPAGSNLGEYYQIL